MSKDKRQYRDLEKDTSYKRTGSSTNIDKIIRGKEEKVNTARNEFFRILERVTQPVSPDQGKKGT